MSSGGPRSPRRRQRRGQKGRVRGAIYARYSHRDQHSIEDQVRACREFADANRIHVPNGLVFADRAVRGCRRRRTGLQALQKALESDAFDVLLVLTTSRIHRKMYRSLGFVEEEIVDRGKRCVFIKSGIDTADPHRWRQLLQMHAMMDEFLGQIVAEHVRVGHEGLLEREMVWGTLAYGYQGEDVIGESTKKDRPRRRTIINPVEAEWVRRVFHWYVCDGLTIGQCVRRLNREKAPLPPKCTTGLWTRQAVRGLLSNPRYRGLWEYGRTRAVYLNRQDYVRQVPRDKPLKQLQVERLRIIDEATWCRTQALLAKEPRRWERRAKSADPKRRPELLNGLLFCKEHDRRMHVGGAHGRYYLCPTCQRLGEPALVTLLNRELAMKVVSEKCAALIRDDAELVDRAMACCREQAESAQRLDPKRLSELRAKDAKLTRRIQFILENAGESPGDHREDAAALATARAERARVRSDIAALEAATSHPVKMPTRGEVEALLDELGAILGRASSSTDEDEIAAARKVIEMITGGKIFVTQAGERKPKRGWLQGAFRCRLLSTSVARLMDDLPSEVEDGLEVTIDFRKQSWAERTADDAKALFDQDMLVKEIATRLGCPGNLVTKSLRIWYERNGQELPDGRTRRASLSRKHLQPPKYQRIADEVARLCNEGRLLTDIAEQLGVDRNTVTQSIRWWHESRGLSTPDGRSRRKALRVKTRKPYKPRRAS